MWLGERAIAFKVGDPADDGTYIGPLTRAAQLDVLEAQVADALTSSQSRRVVDRSIDGTDLGHFNVVRSRHADAFTLLP